jgi:drug/metabolite transporter (DMT)-like permease
MQQKSAADRFAPLLILTAGSMWGSMGLFVRVLGKTGCSNAEIVFLRAIVTAVCLLAYLAVYDRSLFRIRLKDLWCFLGTGLLSIVFFNICYFTTITLTSLAVAAVLLYTAPAIVIVLSAFLFRKRSQAGSSLLF